MAIDLSIHVVANHKKGKIQRSLLRLLSSWLHSKTMNKLHFASGDVTAVTMAITKFLKTMQYPITLTEKEAGLQKMNNNCKILYRFYGYILMLQVGTIYHRKMTFNVIYFQSSDQVGS